MTDSNDVRPGLDFSAEELDLLDRMLADAGVASSADVRITPRADGASTPLSFSQELLWLLDRASPGMTAYKLPIARRLIGDLDIAALTESLTTIVARHEALRTRFGIVDGEPVQIIDPAAGVTLYRVDLRFHVTPEQEAERVVSEIANTPFDLARETMFRPALITISDLDHVLVLDTHHIVFDGWSRDVLFRELATCYTAIRAGHKPVLPELPIQFADFAIWQREQLAGDRLAELLKFWREQLGDEVEPLDLPTDRPRHAAPGFLGGRCRQLIPIGTLAAIKDLGRRHDATLYMVLLAAYMTVLHRYSGSKRVLVGSGSAGRTHTETEGIVGYLNNTLVQRGDFADNTTFGSLLEQVRASALGAYDHQDVPLEKLVMELREGQQQLNDAPLFRAVLTMQDGLESAVEFDGIQVHPFGVDRTATKFDLTLLPAERENGLLLTLQYRTDLYEPATADRFLGHMQRVLEAATADETQSIATLPMLTQSELDQLAHWNAGAGGSPRPPVHRQFERAAQEAPGTIAVRCGANTLTYGALDSLANQLAHRLCTDGVGRGSAVGILLERSADAIVALLGVLKAGGCYVPLAPDAPPARIVQQLAECGATIVVSRKEFADRLPAGVAVVEINADAAVASGRQDTRVVDIGGDDLAYVLFTSGSTGTPKGVAVTHANIAHYTSAIGKVLGMVEDQPLHFATVSTLAADLGNTAIFPALTSGGTLHVLPEDVTLDGPRFAAYATEHPIDVLKITPSHLRAVMSAAGTGARDLLPRRWLVVGGEACPWDLLDEVRRIGSCQVLNHYGPTETTVGACTFAATSRDEAPLSATVPIGFPLADVQLHVLDVASQSMPVGVPGELYIGGSGVAPGYLNRPDLTDARFATAGTMGRLYRTGDRVRRLPSGALEFLGRNDGQVKIRGFRVELGEIEQVLAQFPGIEHAVVVLHPDASEPSILGYVGNGECSRNSS